MNPSTIKTYPGVILSYFVAYLLSGKWYCSHYKCMYINDGYKYDFNQGILIISKIYILSHYINFHNF